MRGTWFGWSVLLLAACDGGEIKLEDDTGGKTSACEVAVTGTDPATGATGVAVNATVSFTLSEADATATISADYDGATTVSDDGLTLTWTASAPLAAETTYAVTLDWCGGSEVVSFTTVEALDIDVGGKTYALELQNASIDEPAGVGSILAGQLPEFILMEVVSADTSSITFMGALAIEGSTDQDTCTATIGFPAADFGAAPFFAVGPQDTTLSVAGYSATLYAMELQGTFTSDGSRIEDGSLRGSIDMREVAELLGYTPDDACGLLAMFGATCESCPQDGEGYCVTLAASQLEGDAVDGLDLIEVADNDCPGCEDGEPECL